ncbi:MAG: hypothetical protein ACP5MB_06425 [bacterium]
MESSDDISEVLVVCDICKQKVVSYHPVGKLKLCDNCYKNIKVNLDILIRNLQESEKQYDAYIKYLEDIYTNR